MEQHISQDEIRRIIISDMVKKRNSIVPARKASAKKARKSCGDIHQYVEKRY